MGGERGGGGGHGVGGRTGQHHTFRTRPKKKNCCPHSRGPPKGGGAGRQWSLPAHHCDHLRCHRAPKGSPAAGDSGVSRPQPIVAAGTLSASELCGLLKPKSWASGGVGVPSRHLPRCPALVKTMSGGQIRRQAIGQAWVRIAPCSPRLEEDVDVGVLGCESHIPGGLLDHVCRADVLSCGAGKGSESE